MMVCEYKSIGSLILEPRVFEIYDTTVTIQNYITTMENLDRQGTSPTIKTAPVLKLELRRLKEVIKWLILKFYV